VIVGIDHARLRRQIVGGLDLAAQRHKAQSQYGEWGVEAYESFLIQLDALDNTGGPASEKAPAGRSQYAWVMESGKADVFLTYCTNAVLARKEVASLQIVEIPPQLASGRNTGWCWLAPAPATLLARYILGEDGRHPGEAWLRAWRSGDM
jgi:hypothetical protein